MKRKLLIIISLFTVLVCCLFVGYNPNIADNLTADFSDGEIITSQDGHFDFKAFTMNSTKAEKFTTKTKTPGHTKFIDTKNNITINFLQLDKMIQTSRDWHGDLLKSELERPAWTVDGITVHEIDFILHDPLYSAYEKDSSENIIIYLSTPDEKETAEMMNSLKFN